MVYVFSVGGAFFYGLASVLQHRAAARAPDDESMRIGLLVRLARSPLWAMGAACDVLGFVMQACALDRGPLTLVQPLLTVGLLFALILAAGLDRRRPNGGELLAALALVAGLSLLLAVGSPDQGRDTVSFHRWIAAGTPLCLAVGALVLWGKTAGPRIKPVALAIAAALTFAASDALIKSTVSVLSAQGIVEVLDGWYLYALIVVGLLGMLVIQSAFQAGPLSSSLPVLTAVEPIASSAVGVVLFAEQLRSDAFAISAEVLAAGLALAGIWVLARSPVVLGLRAHPGAPAEEPAHVSPGST